MPLTNRRTIGQNLCVRDFQATLEIVRASFRISISWLTDTRSPEVISGSTLMAYRGLYLPFSFNFPQSTEGVRRKNTLRVESFVVAYLTFGAGIFFSFSDSFCSFRLLPRLLLHSWLSLSITVLPSSSSLACYYHHRWNFRSFHDGQVARQGMFLLTGARYKNWLHFNK